MATRSRRPPLPVTSDVLDYDEVFAKFDATMDWLARIYVHALNCIHYMHDKYFYERLEMALHDRDILRTMASGIAGLSVVADSLSAIRYAKVRVIRDDKGLAFDYEIEGDFPKYGNADSRVDDIAADLVSRFMAKMRKHPTYRGATHTQSVLTITSNVVYGKNTGNTPDGRRKGEPFAPGANPMHGRDTHGWLASCISVGQLPYADAQDGISYTVSISPNLTQRDGAEGIDNAVKAFDAYFGQGGFHMNLNVLSNDTLEGRHGASGEVSAAHHPRVGLCRELRAADARAAARRHQPHLSRQVLTGRAMSDLEPIEVGSRHDLRAARSPDAPDTERLRRHVARPSAGSIPTRPARRSTGRASASRSSCRAACCAASICHNPDTWHLKDGTRVELAQAVRRLADFAPMLRAMGGGLTISGGEPLVQMGFTGGMFAAAKRMGLHTALDTSGFLGARADDDYLANVDLVLLDIKSGDPETYRKVTGKDLAPTLRFAERLQRHGQAGLGPLRAGARADRRTRQYRDGRALRGADEERRMGRGAAVPPDGRLQVEVAGPRVPAGRHAAADARRR